MPRLRCDYREFISILLTYNFVLSRHDGTSHRQYRAVIKGEVKLVTVACHNEGDDIPVGTLKAMIRQSGLPSKIFRK